MPLALIFALAASLGVHLLALFVPDIDLGAVSAPSVLIAELQPQPKAVLPLTARKKLPRKAPRAKRSQPPARFSPLPSATLAISIPELNEALNINTPNAPTETEPVQALLPSADLPPTEPPLQARLPAHGKIRYRVDRGEQGFEVGRSTQEWTLENNRYRLTAVSETSGLAALLKPMRVELESQGRLTAEGLQPEQFIIRRNGEVGREQADFDWAQRQIRTGGDDSNAVTQPLTPGAQDLLSFNYQLGFLAHPKMPDSLAIATGKKYTIYPLEALGDEEIDIPAGVFRTLHLRAPGDNSTELWLAYDYFLLPVKIRHLDRHGDSFVQVASEIQFSKEPSSP